MSEKGASPDRRTRGAGAARRRSRDANVVAGSLSPELHESWRALGRSALVEHASVKVLASRARQSKTFRVVLMVRDAAELTSAVLVANAQKGRPGCRLVLLVGRGDSAMWTCAAALTPHCYPAELEPGSLARLIASSMESRRLDRGRRAELPDRITITLWEHVEVDGRKVYLGVGERNFLFHLARRPGIAIAKRELIEAGGSMRLPASTCRRRLGQRLGPVLTTLLIPQTRFEPYRLREPEEVAAVSRATQGSEVRLRIIGRAEVMMVGGR